MTTLQHKLVDIQYPLLLTFYRWEASLIESELDLLAKYVKSILLLAVSDSQAIQTKYTDNVHIYRQYTIDQQYPEYTKDKQYIYIKCVIVQTTVTSVLE